MYIVDDHPLVRKSLGKVIAGEPDMTVCGEAATAAVAYEDIASLLPDVAVVDLSLKRSSGLDLIKQISGLNRKVGVIVLSVHSEHVYGLRSLNAGARGYVAKQDPAGRILEAIRLVAAGGVFASAELASRVLDHLSPGGRRNGVAPEISLAERELDVVDLIGQGHTTKEIAVRLGVSTKTIATHRSHIKRKLLLRTSHDLVHFCVRWRNERPQPVNSSASVDARRAGRRPAGGSRVAVFRRQDAVAPHR